MGSIFLFVIYIAVLHNIFVNCQSTKNNKNDNQQSKAATASKKFDANDQKGNTPFFLQDPYDQMCLGPKGFTVCDETTLWMLTRRSGKQTFSLVSLFSSNTNGICLETKTTGFGLVGTDLLGLGPCNKAIAQSWEFDFIDQSHVRLQNRGRCLVRGKKTYKSTASVQNCKKGDFLPLTYHPTAVHENGFYLKAADGTCFDGTKFTTCTTELGSSKLLWGVGIKYIWGQAWRYFYNMNISDRSNCIVAKGNKVEKSSCTEKGALGWVLHDGQLATNSGKKCIARKSDDKAVLAKCEDASEFIAMEVPQVYTNEELAAMLQNKNIPSEEKAAYAEQLQRRTLSKNR